MVVDPSRDCRVYQFFTDWGSSPKINVSSKSRGGLKEEEGILEGEEDIAGEGLESH
jgi:hypothetical protein